MQSKHDPWFSLEWFRLNKDSIHRELNFWGEVLFWLNPRFARIKIYKKQGIAKFWTIDKKGRFDLVHTIKLLKNNRIKVGKRKALKFPVVWALAVRLKFLQFPRKWKKISKWFTWKTGAMCLKRKDDKYVFLFKDIYGKAVYVPIEFFTPQILDYIYNICNTKNRSRVSGNNVH